MVIDYFLLFVSCTIYAVAFVYGAFKLFHKGVPLYFQIIVCAVGCYALGELAMTVIGLCYPNGNSIIYFSSMFSYAGGAAFLLTANVGVLGREVYKKASRKAAVIALIAPAVDLSISICIIVLTWSVDLVYCFAVLLYTPEIISCYHNLRHLLSHDDGILRSIRGCDIWTLVLLISSNLYSLLSVIISDSIYLVMGVVFSISAFMLVKSAVKGAKTWKI